MESLSKSVSAEQVQTTVGPVKAHLCKTAAASLLNKLFMIQHFHNGIDLSKHQLSVISSAQDRAAVLKDFSAHVKEILGTLSQLVTDKNLDKFMEYLGEETKNLAARLGKQGAIDKKVERQIRLDLIERCRQMHDDFIQESKKSARLPAVRSAFANALNLQSLRQGCYLGFGGD